VVEEGAPASPVVEEGALAPVSKPTHRTPDRIVVSRRSQSDLLNHRGNAARRRPQQATPVVEEGALAPVSKPPHRTVVSRRSQSDLLNHQNDAL
jgi:hypothetical protein